MEELILPLTAKISFVELFSYFSSEFICLLGIFINYILYLFFRAKNNIKRISDFTTFGVLALNCLITFSIYIRNKLYFKDFDFPLFKGTMALSDENLLYKFLIYLFFALFLLFTYKLTRKFRYKTPVVNLCLLALALVSTLLLQAENGALAFLFLDFCAFFIYKHASNMRVRKIDYFSDDFIFMSSTSTILFFSFYIIYFFLKEELQVSIIQVCMSCALLLKAGLFPIYNYTLNKQVRNNLVYSMLLFGFLPFMGVITFAKFTQAINITYEIYFITVCVFVLLVMLISALNALKTNSLINYLANSIYTYCSLHVFAILSMQDKNLYMSAIFLSMFCIFLFNALLSILKINLRAIKLNINTINGLFVRNRLFCALFAFVILLTCNIIPSALLIKNLEILKGIYLFDKIGFCVLIVFVFSNVLILLNSLRIIKSLYTKNQISLKLAKRTTFLYVVLFVILILFILSIFL